MKEYFEINSATTQDDLRIKYQEYAKILHPDKGGSEREFNDMKNQYDVLKNNLTDIKVFNDMIENGKNFMVKLVGFVLFLVERNKSILPQSFIQLLGMVATNYINGFDAYKLRKLFIEYISKK